MENNQNMGLGVTENVVPNNTPSEEPIIKETKKSKKILVVILIILAILVVIIGVYLEFIANSKRVISSAINKLSTNIENTINLSESDLVLGDNIAANGNIKFDINSKYLESLGAYDETYAAYSKILSNINSTENTFSVIQNKTDKKLLASIDSKFDGSSLINAKYLIQDDKAYYFIADFLDKYVDTGENDYFKSLSDSTTATENIKYLYDFSIKSFKNNLKDKYFEQKDVTKTINGKEEKVKKVSLVLNSENAIELANAILSDLKNDKKANEILTSYNEDFKDAKVDKTEYDLSSTDKFNITVYVNSITYQAKMYEIEMIADGSDVSATYYEDGNYARVDLYSNTELYGSLEIKKEDTKTTFDVIDASKQNLGSIVLTKKDHDVNVEAKVTIEGIEINFSMDSKVTNLEKNKSYDNTVTAKAKVYMEATEIVDATITSTMKVTTDATINEDVSTAVKESALTDTETDKLDTLLSNALMKLMM